MLGRVENIVGKGENAGFSQCFQKACFPGASKGVIVWEWVKMHVHLKSHLDQSINWRLAES